LNKLKIMRLSLLTSFVVTILLASVLHGFLPTLPVNGQPGSTTISVVPQHMVAGLSKFLINVTIANVSDLFGFQVKILFDPTVLNATKGTYPSDYVFLGKTAIWAPPVINNTAGYVLFGVSIVYGSTFSGSGRLCQIEFQPKTFGVSDINFSRPLGEKTVLLDDNLDEIPFDAVDGFAEVAEIHDIAVTGVSTSSTSIGRGFVLSTYVTVVNEGTIDETFNVTTYANTTVTDVQTVFLAWGSSTVMNFVWNTTDAALGEYQIWAEAAIVPGETDTDDNTLYNGFVEVVDAHDVAITYLNIDPTTVGQGFPVYIYAGVENQGNHHETLNVTVYANATTVAKEPVYLTMGSSTGLVFLWNTTSTPVGNYQIRAEADVVPSEVDVTDNVLTGGLVQVSAPIHDVAVTDVRTSTNIAILGDPVIIEIDVANYGNGYEEFWVKAYADAETTTIGDEAIIANLTVLLPQSFSTTLFCWWNTTGATPSNLTISAKAQVVQGETSTTNNLFVDGWVQFLPYVHDVAVTGVRSLESAGYTGDQISVEVFLQNQGNRFETFNVTAYSDLDATTLGDEVLVGTSLVSMESYETRTVTFNWDTTGLSGGNYTISAAATQVPEEFDLSDNNKTNGIVRLFQAVPCPDVNVTCPAAVTLNPSFFDWSWDLRARLVNIGNLTVESTGFEGYLRVVGSTNGTLRLCVNEPDAASFQFYLPQHGKVQIPLWLMFQPEEHWGYYRGTYTLRLVVCGTHYRELTIRNIDIDVCQNSAYTVRNQTATFSWNLTGGSLVYLTAETNLPAGWTYSVDPPIGTFFETPHIVTVNITASPDAGEGETGFVTLRAFKNSTGAMIWQFIYFASTENKPPTIEEFKTPTLTPDGYLLFNATAKDGSGIADVSLHYSVDSGTWQNRTMLWASGDNFNSTRYSIREYLGSEPKTVQYYVSATDWFGNQTLSETRTVNIMNDIEVGCVNANETYVLPTTNFTLSVKVLNRGTLPLSFVNLAIYANSTLVSTQPIVNLPNGTETTLNLSLQLPYGRYILTAYAANLPFEAVVTNNANDTMVTVALTGDINIDRKVDLKDVYAVGRAYGAVPGHARWNVVCDINGDGKIDLKDYYTTCKNYGKTW